MHIGAAELSACICLFHLFGCERGLIIFLLIGHILNQFGTDEFSAVDLNLDLAWYVRKAPD